MPRKLKPPSLRQRRNKASTRATLRAGGMRAPALPVRGCPCGGPVELPKPPRGKRKRGWPRKPPEVCAECRGTGTLPWHHLTVAWWGRLWASPMGPEYIESDVDALYITAGLVEAFWRGGTADKALAAEIRQEMARFGGSPLDRRRLEWGLEEPDEAGAAVAPPEPEKPRDDPRNVLRMVRPA